MGKKRNLAIKKRNYFYIGIDFDNCVVCDWYPEVGLSLGAESVLKDLVKNGHKLILWTLRSEKFLEDAVAWFKSKGIELYGVNENPDFAGDEKSRKVFCDLYIDDKSLMSPLIPYYDAPNDRVLYVADWKKIEQELIDLNLI